MVGWRKKPIKEKKNKKTIPPSTPSSSDDSFIAVSDIPSAFELISPSEGDVFAVNVIHLDDDEKGGWLFLPFLWISVLQWSAIGEVIDDARSHWRDVNEEGHTSSIWCDTMMADSSIRTAAICRLSERDCPVFVPSRWRWEYRSDRSMWRRSLWPIRARLRR